MCINSIELQLPDVSKRTIYLTDVIDNVSAREFTEKLNEIDFEDYHMMKSNIAKISSLGVDVDNMSMPPVKVFINSPGGYIYDALSIYDMIHKRTDMMCVCSGKVMSAATFILLGFDPELRFATENTTFMIHQPSSMTFGRLKDMEEDVEETKRLHKIITNIYLKNSKIPKDVLDKIYKEKKDYYFTAKEALKWGFIKKIV